MPGNRCEFITCQKRKTNYPNLSLYRFPTQDHERLQKWIINSGNESLFGLKPEQLKARYVCELHFSSESFVNVSKHRLVQSAVPVIWTSIPSAETPSTSAPPNLRLKSPKHVYINKKKNIKKETKVTMPEEQDSYEIRKFLDF